MVKGLFCWILYVLLPFKPDASVAAHPYYVSVTEIEHNAASQALEITCRIFTDDFEKTLRQKFNTKVDLFGDAQQNANSLVASYIGQHLKFTADGKALTLKYVGYERQKEACWCYFEVSGVSAPKKLSVFNNLLHDYTDKQINMIHATVGGSRKSYKLDYPNTTKEFEF